MTTLAGRRGLIDHHQTGRLRGHQGDADRIFPIIRSPLVSTTSPLRLDPSTRRLMLRRPVMLFRGRGPMRALAVAPRIVDCLRGSL
jgi:hypothetical protein